MAPRSKRSALQITEDDLRILEPLLIAARAAVARTKWRLGDPIEELTGFIALSVIAAVSKQLQEFGIIGNKMEEQGNGPDDCGFYQ